MTIEEAEYWLNEYRTRDNAALASDVETWDEAYRVAYGQYRAERDFKAR